MTDNGCLEYVSTPPIGAKSPGQESERKSLVSTIWSRRPWATGVFGAFCSLHLVLFSFLRHYQGALQALANGLRSAMEHSPTSQLKLSKHKYLIYICIYDIFIYLLIIYIYIYKYTCVYVCVCVCACVYVSEKYIMFSSKNKKISIFVRMYTIGDNK